MSDQHFDEAALRKRCRESEKQLKPYELKRLSLSRQAALSQENHWYAEYKNLFSSALVAATLAAIFILPIDEDHLNSTDSLYHEDNVSLLMEDPDFYLWLNDTGMLIAER